MFAADWRRHGGDIEVLQTHGGSGAQAEAVIAGEPGDGVIRGVLDHICAAPSH